MRDAGAREGGRAALRVSGRVAIRLLTPLRGQVLTPLRGQVNADVRDMDRYYREYRRLRALMWRAEGPFFASNRSVPLALSKRTYREWRGQ